MANHLKMLYMNFLLCISKYSISNHLKYCDYYTYHTYHLFNITKLCILPTGHIHMLSMIHRIKKYNFSREI
jgi:hypothetical protein